MRGEGSQCGGQMQTGSEGLWMGEDKRQEIRGGHQLIPL